MHRVAMLQAARVVDVPLGQVVVPRVRHATPDGLHARRRPIRSFTVGARIDRHALRFGPAVAHQLQPPRPAARIGRCGKAATVETRPPLLAGIARLITALDGERLMPPGLKRRPDARPVGGREPIRHAIHFGPCRRGRQEEHQQEHREPGPARAGTGRGEREQAESLRTMKNVLHDDSCRRIGTHGGQAIRDTCEGQRLALLPLAQRELESKATLRLYTSPPLGRCVLLKNGESS